MSKYALLSIQPTHLADVGLLDLNRCGIGAGMCQYANTA